MLDEKDLQAIATLINVSTEKTDQQFREIKGEIGEIKGEISEMKGEISEMKGEIADVKGEISEMKGEFANVKGEISEMKGEIANVKSEIIEIRGQVKASEKLLLDELGYIQSYFEKQIAQVQKNIDELQQYYKIAKLENDNTTLLLKMIETLQKDIEELKKKTA